MLISKYFPLCSHSISDHIIDSKPHLVQATVASDTWKLLLVVSFLNKTAAQAAIPVFFELIATWPTPFDLSNANLDELIDLLRPLGLQNSRAKRFVLLSQMYIAHPPELSTVYKSRNVASYPPTCVSNYPGVGRYALDSFRIFSPILSGGGAPAGERSAIARVVKWCKTNSVKSYLPQGSDKGEEWKRVIPQDKELIKYLVWRWAIEGYIWDPETGASGRSTAEYIRSIPHWVPLITPPKDV
ncbi:hypothetical protein FRC02_003709 [Tulasnella sp. 418]|nr:hypothetical protein FRC02_003709 [Tulasnella sp. 418]